MGQALPGIIQALSCEKLYTHVLNSMTCESQCGICGCRCHTDEIEVDEETASVDVDSCCGMIHYTTEAHDAHNHE